MIAHDLNRNRGPWCVVCAVEKRSSNHWFKIIDEPRVRMVAELDDQRPGDPVCGEACAVKKISEWMSARKARR